jgi:cytochrome c1
MKRSTLLAALLLVPALASAETETDWKMQPFTPNLRNLPSLQHGAALFVNYCVGCHSLKFQRYERTADDLDIPHDMVVANLIFTDQKIGALMSNAMPQEASRSWFGATPPDLTLVAKLRGADWVYNYLKAFYVDPSRPFGVNNKVLPNVGMPHVLLELQGIPMDNSCRQVPMRAENGGEARDPLVPGATITEKKCTFIDVVEGSGSLTAQQYDNAVYDITNFLYYVAEPARMERERLGVYVLLFLVVLFVFAALLGREYNKEIR